MDAWLCVTDLIWVGSWLSRVLCKLEGACTCASTLKFCKWTCKWNTLRTWKWIHIVCMHHSDWLDACMFILLFYFVLCSCTCSHHFTCISQNAKYAVICTSIVCLTSFQLSMGMKKGRKQGRGLPDISLGTTQRNSSLWYGHTKSNLDRGGMWTSHMVLSIAIPRKGQLWECDQFAQYGKKWTWSDLN